MKMYRIFEGGKRLVTVNYKSQISPAIEKYRDIGHHITSVVCFSPSSGKINEIIKEYDCVVNPAGYKYRIHCANCGAKFGANKADKRYCSTNCASEAWHGKSYRSTFSEFVEPLQSTAASKSKTKKKNIETLSEINAAARKLGMTYGQYMGMQYAQGLR